MLDLRPTDDYTNSESKYCISVVSKLFLIELVEIYFRYIPTDDLVAIYTRYYGYEVMHKDVIDECVIWMYLGR